VEASKRGLSERLYRYLQWGTWKTLKNPLQYSNWEPHEYKSEEKLLKSISHVTWDGRGKCNPRVNPTSNADVIITSSYIKYCAFDLRFINILTHRMSNLYRQKLYFGNSSLIFKFNLKSSPSVITDTWRFQKTLNEKLNPRARFPAVYKLLSRKLHVGLFHETRAISATVSILCRIGASENMKSGCYTSLLKSTRGSGCHKPHCAWTAIQNMRDVISQCAASTPCCLERKMMMIMMIIRYFLYLRAHSTPRRPIIQYVRANGHILWW
jgi:hypothetical protein